MTMTQKATTGADAVDVAIANGVDLDGTPIPAAKLDLYNTVMANTKSDLYTSGME
jgi:hypothetical protein